jgi:hypothetical protein
MGCYFEGFTYKNSDGTLLLECVAFSVLMVRYGLFFFSVCRCKKPLINDINLEIVGLGVFLVLAVSGVPDWLCWPGQADAATVRHVIKPQPD